MRTHEQPKTAACCYAVAGENEYDLHTGAIQTEWIESRLTKAYFECGIQLLPAIANPIEWAFQSNRDLDRALHFRKAKLKKVPYHQIKAQKTSLRKSRALRAGLPSAALAIG